MSDLKSICIDGDCSTVPSYLAGSGIGITNGVISNTAPGVTYTAGTGITIDQDNVISATGTSAQTMTPAEMEAGTDTTGKLVTAKDLKDVYVNATGDNMTGSLIFQGVTYGLLSKDGTGQTHALIKNTSSNTWVGANYEGARHHNGNLIFAAGYDHDLSEAIEWLLVAIANADNTGTDHYEHILTTERFPTDYIRFDTGKVPNIEVAANSTVSVTIPAPVISGYNCRGIINGWTDYVGTTEQANISDVVPVRIWGINTSTDGTVMYRNFKNAAAKFTAVGLFLYTKKLPYTT